MDKTQLPANLDTHQTQNISITFIQRPPNVFDVGPTLYICHTNVLCFLGSYAKFSLHKTFFVRPICCRTNFGRVIILPCEAQRQYLLTHCLLAFESNIVGNTSLEIGLTTITCDYHTFVVIKREDIIIPMHAGEIYGVKP